MKQLGLVRAGSRRERSALTKSEARNFINQLIAHPRIRQKASELRPHEDISGYVIDHDLSPRQVVLSVRADAPLSLQHKQAKRGLPEEIPQDLYGWTNLGSQAQGRVVFWVMPTRIRQFTLTFHKITPGEGAGARFEQLDLHSGSMLTCPVDVSGARPGQLWCDATYRVPRRAI